MIGLALVWTKQKEKSEVNPIVVIQWMWNDMRVRPWLFIFIIKLRNTCTNYIFQHTRIAFEQRYPEAMAHQMPTTNNQKLRSERKMKMKHNEHHQKKRASFSNICFEFGIKSIYVPTTSMPVSIKKDTSKRHGLNIRHLLGKFRRNETKTEHILSDSRGNQKEKWKEKRKNWYSQRDLSFICEFHYA